MPSRPAVSCVLQEVAAFIALRDARAGENEKAGTPCLTRDSGFSWILADPVLVEVGGIEPPSEGTPSPALHA